MTKKRKVIIASAAIAAAVSVFAATGVTLAMTLTDNTGSGTLRAGDVALTAQATNVKAYSAVKTQAGGQNTFEHEGVTYKYEQGVISDGKANFSHGGGVSYTAKDITINQFLPGDKVEFDIEVTSTSSLSFYYHAELRVNALAGQKLLNQLDFFVDEQEVLHRDVSGEAGADGKAPIIITDNKACGADRTEVEKVHISIEFPIAATDGQEQAVTFEYLAQGTNIPVEQPDVAEVTINGTTQNFTTLGEAVAYAETHNISEITVKNGTVLDEGEVRITRAMRFTGVPDENKKLPAINGGLFTVSEGSAATFTNLEFNGTSYIDVSESTALTLENCKINIAAIKYFDKSTRSYLPEAAFIVSGGSTVPVRLTLKNNTFVADKGAAICMRSLLRDGTELTGNTFGTESKSYSGSAVLSVNGAEPNATVIMSRNTLYGNLPLSLGGKANARYTVVSLNNNASGTNITAFANGTSAATFLDSGSTINGAALTTSDIGAGLLLGAVNVTFGERNRVAAGKVVLSDGIKAGEFYTNYVISGTLSQNAIELYKDGVLYAYLNSSSSNAGYVVDEIQSL